MNKVGFNYIQKIKRVNRYIERCLCKSCSRTYEKRRMKKHPVEWRMQHLPRRLLQVLPWNPGTLKCSSMRFPQRKPAWTWAVAAVEKVVGPRTTSKVPAGTRRTLPCSRNPKNCLPSSQIATCLRQWKREEKGNRVEFIKRELLKAPSLRN